ncbi:MAG: hypothetical protein MK212_05680 [Saprospiraceae bacterium]|nr:hypothetical protein [Saprospiraceae bacterium]
MNYTTRLSPEVYKPIVDNLLIKFSQYLTTDTNALKKILAELIAEGSSWEYTLEALKKTRPYIYTEVVQSKLQYEWGNTLLSSNKEEEEDEEEDWDEDEEEDWDINDVDLNDYPEESHEAIQQETFWVCEDADITGIWKQANEVEKIYHAHMEGFWILGEDAIDFLEKSIQKVMTA